MGKGLYECLQIDVRMCMWHGCINRNLDLYVCEYSCLHDSVDVCTSRNVDIYTCGRSDH